MALQAGIGLSRQKDPLLAAEEAVLGARLNLHNTKASLAFVFSSADLACVDLLKAIAAYLKDVPILGASGAGVITNKGIYKHGLAVLLLAFSDGLHFHTACVKEIKTKSSLKAGEELGDGLLSGLKNTRRILSVIFSDGLTELNSGLLTGLQVKLGRSFPVVGASAADNFSFKKTYVYFNQEIFSDGASGLLLGGKLNFGLGTKHGWKPLGKARRVTKASANVVQEIDNEPAVKIYEDYLAMDIEGLRGELKRISILYPLGIRLEGEEEFLLRNISSILHDGSLVFQGDLPSGSQVRLMIGTKESCLNAARQAADEVKKGLSGQLPRFALVFNSASRYMLLGRQAEKELEIIKEGMGKDTPLIGLYTYGEQAPLRSVNYLGRTHFHNQTITVLGIGD